VNVITYTRVPWKGKERPFAVCVQYHATEYTASTTDYLLSTLYIRFRKNDGWCGIDVIFT